MRKKLTEEQIEFINGLPEKYGDMLTKYAYRFFGYQSHLFPTAEDAVQETFIKAVKDIETLMGHENPAGWLIQSLRYTLLHTSRHLKSTKEDLTADMTDPSVSKRIAIDAVDRWEQKYNLSEVIETADKILTSEEQATFKDHFLMGYTIQETAAMEKTTSDTIRSRINRIRKKLKKYFGIMCIFLIQLHYFH